MLKNMLRRSSSNHYKSHAYTVDGKAIIKEDLQLFLDLSNGRDFTTLQSNHYALFASTCVEVANNDTSI